MAIKFNKKLEEGPWGEGGRKETEYPWVQGEADVLGRTRFKYANPDKPENASEVEFNYDGSFTAKEVDNDKKGLTNSLNHMSLRYNTQGSSEQVDGHSDSNTESTKRTNVAGDNGTSVGGDAYDGTGGKRMVGAKEGSFDNDADGNTYKTSKGDVVTEHTGSKYASLEGDDVTSVVGNKIQMISEGDYSLHLQGGNLDTRVESGEMQLYSGDSLNVNTAAAATYRSKETTTIVSDLKIILKVGSSSITIEDGSITIKADRIDLNP
jgi:hypothetical protein